MRNASYTVVFSVLACCFCLIARGDDIVLSNGMRRQVLVTGTRSEASTLQPVNYWILRVYEPNVGSLSRGVPEEEKNVAGLKSIQLKPGDFDRIRERWKSAGLSLDVILRDGRRIALHNCNLEWSEPKGYIASINGVRVGHVSWGPRGQDRMDLGLKTGPRRVDAIGRIRFADDGSLTVTLKDGSAFTDRFDSETKTPDGMRDLTGSITGFVYADRGGPDTQDSSIPLFSKSTILLEGVREIVVTGAPQEQFGPSLSNYTLRQSLDRKPPTVITRTSRLAGNVPFSMEISGRGFTPDDKVTFCYNYSCGPDSVAADITGRSSDLLTIDKVTLKSGLWYLEVRNPDGPTARSENFVTW